MYYVTFGAKSHDSFYNNRGERTRLALRENRFSKKRRLTSELFSFKREPEKFV